MTAPSPSSSPVSSPASSPPSSPADGRGDLADVVERVASAVVGLVSRRRGVNAGVVWQDGLVVTSASAIGRTSRLPVIAADGEARDGEVRGLDPTTDLAVIAVATNGLTPASRRDGPALRVGDFVFATGRNAAGLIHASFGHVGAAGGAWRTWRGGTVDRLIRLDGGLYPGLAGAPVADRDGRIAGIASPMLSRHHGIVLPVATVDRIAAHLLAHGSVQRRYIGVIAQPVALTPGLSASLGAAGDEATTAGSANGASAAAAAGSSATADSSDPAHDDARRTGLLVTGIGSDSPAERGGLLPGDIIVRVADQWVGDLEALRSAIAIAPVDAALSLQILRGGQPISIDVIVAARDATSGCRG